MKAIAMRRWAAGAGLGALVGLGACSGTTTLDQDDLEEQLRVQLSEDAGVDPDGVTVECPSGIEVEEGRTFDCELTAPNGDLVTVEVTLTDDDGSFEAVVPDQPFDE
jgi:hypothetical protein